MIIVTVVFEQGIQLAVPRVIAIDPEKIVDVRRRGIFTEIDYAESYDRKWKPITYQITAALPNIQAAIQGDWVGKEYLSATVIYGEPREMRPNIWEDTYAIDIQQKFIIDIEEVYLRYPWSTTDELVTKLRFTSSAFLQKVVYVTEHLHDLVPDVPSETTTTTTELLPPQCPEGSVYSGWMTVGTDNLQYGFIVDTFGSLNPISTIDRFFIWVVDIEVLAITIPDCQNPVVYIDGVEFAGFVYDGEENSWVMSNVLTNPFATVGELSSICVVCGETTTTTEEPVTTTTVVYDEIYLSNFYYVGAPPPFTQYGDTLESACEVLGMVQSVTLMYTWGYLVPDGLGSFYVYEHYTHTLMDEGYYLWADGEGGYLIYYVDGTGLTTLLPYACETTTTTPEPEVTTTTTPIQ
jgi:hypothetical protein